MPYGSNGLIGLLVLIADVYAIISILGSNATNGAKALWVIIILLLPVVGFILWYFLGPKGYKRLA